MPEEARAGLVAIDGGLAEERGGAYAVGSRAWASRMRRRAKELVQTLDTGYMELASILYKVWDTPIDGDRTKPPVYTLWGFASYFAYAEQELGLDQPKAGRLRLIYEVLEHQMDSVDQAIKQRLVNLGYAKMRELIRVLTPRNAVHWVEEGERLGWRQLQKAITAESNRLRLLEAQAAAGELPASAEDTEGPVRTPDDEIASREVFVFYPAQLVNVRLALEKARSLSQSDRKSHNLDLICTDFLATNDFMEGDLDKRLRYIAKIERGMGGLKLVAIDPEAGEVVYGYDALEAIAKTDA
jgi:hypothetical protein